MSGGHFDYKQYHVRDIYESIEFELEKQGKLKPKDDLWYDNLYLIEHPDERYYPTLSDDVNIIFKNAIGILKIAEIYAQRIDWFLSGDDGEDSLKTRLINDINKLNYNCDMSDYRKLTDLSYIVDTENGYDKLGDIGGKFDDAELYKYIQSHGHQRVLEQLAYLQYQVIDTVRKINQETDSLNTQCCKNPAEN